MDEHVLLRFDREEEKQLKWPTKRRLNPVFVFFKKNQFFFKKKTQENRKKDFIHGIWISLENQHFYL